MPTLTCIPPTYFTYSLSLTLSLSASLSTAAKAEDGEVQLLSQSSPTSLFSASWLPKMFQTNKFMGAAANSQEQHAATRCNTLQHTATHCNTAHSGERGSGSGTESSSLAEIDDKNNNLAQTLGALRHDLRAKEGHSRKLRQKLTQVFHPDSFAPEEPWKHSHARKNMWSYGTASAIHYPADDAQHYRNQWFFDYASPHYTGRYDDTAQHDQFSPNEPWNNRPNHITLDSTYADVQRQCTQAGKDHKWDSRLHECLYKGVAPYPELPRGRGVTQEGPSRKALDGGPIAGEPCQGDDVDEFGACRPIPEGEVDQYGWRPGDRTRNGFKNPYDTYSETRTRGRRERDTTLDYQTADLEKACRMQMAKPVVGSFYSWDAWHGKCL